mgnify:CR=1 FL=1
MLSFYGFSEGGEAMEHRIVDFGAKLMLLRILKYIDKAPTVDKLGYINSQNTNYIIIDTYDKNQLVYYDNDLYVLNRTTNTGESSKEEDNIINKEEPIQQEENNNIEQPEEQTNQEQIKQEQ